MMNVIRLERTLFKRLSDSEGFLGKIEWIYKGGFYVLGSDGRPLFFQKGKWLHVPFSIVVDRHLENWMKRAALLKGDRFFKKGALIYRWPQDRCYIRIFPQEVIDLDRTLYDSPPEPEIIRNWVHFLTLEILKRGRFEGMGGALILLRDRFPQPVLGGTIPLSLYSHYTLSDITVMLQSTTNGDLEGFRKAWEKLVGLGPGLTPSGDDVLVGFLASHKILSSDFWKKLKDSNLQKSLAQFGRRKTTSVASEFLCYALEGIFSETLHHVFETLAENKRKKINRSAIQAYLNWGHSSGTDTLVGVTLGLSTLF